MKKRFFCACCTAALLRVLCPLLLFAADTAKITVPDIFNANITQEELWQLEEGAVLHRNIGQTKNISIDFDHPFIKQCTEQMRQLKPAYLIETIQFRSVHENPSLPESVGAELLHVENYVGIPYYSVRAEEWYELYEAAETISSEKNGTETYMRADLTMSPFGLIQCDISADIQPDKMYYEMVNLNNLKYRDSFTCVREKKMKSFICVVKIDDLYLLYGISGVDAPSVFFLRNRIETSLINRIKTFSDYFFERH
ncbi:MAG: hypothetical protein NC041_03885 [Bacteroides sp.]|nr:hypothetical protein [Prevotella sp.]MCM1407847.1 hypothetical protein [Treponema brennaborense]MCM1469589.1 hypothetical protein [Bacteroides sp.]